MPSEPEAPKPVTPAEIAASMPSIWSNHFYIQVDLNVVRVSFLEHREGHIWPRFSVVLARDDARALSHLLRNLLDQTNDTTAKAD